MLDMERDRSVDGTSDRTYGERIMHLFRQMNHYGLVGEAKLRGVELAERAKLLSWSRMRPGEHDDKHTNEELLAEVEGWAQEFERLQSETDDVITTKSEAYLENLKIHEEAVEREEEMRVKGERPPREEYNWPPGQGYAQGGQQGGQQGPPPVPSQGAPGPQPGAGHERREQRREDRREDRKGRSPWATDKQGRMVVRVTRSSGR